MTAPGITQHSMSDLALARDLYLSGDATPPHVRRVVLEAWQRSHDHGVDPDRLPQQDPDADRLREARAASSPLLESAEPFITLMHETLAEQRHLIAVADGAGFVLRVLDGSGLPQGVLERTNLVEGVSWHERDIGSNGVGTSLATGAPVILIGPEHFQEEYQDWTCIGVPIHGPDGRIVGALDLSVPNEAAHAQSWGWTLSVGQAIENSLQRAAPTGRAEAELQVDPPNEPAHSVRGVLDLLVDGLALSPTHSRFLDEARSGLTEVQAAVAERMEAALNRERELIGRLIDTIPVMIVVYDPAIQRVSLNRHVERVVGWTNADLEDTDIMEACYPDPEYRDQVRQFMESLDEGWRDFRMTARDGSIVEVSWANIRLTDDRQVGIGIDITERKASEREIQRSYEEMRRALQERDHILAVVSHDLRNPLNATLMATSLLFEDISEEKKQAQVGVIRRAVDQMQRLLEDLLDAARIEGGGLRILPEPCGCAALVTAAVESLSPLAQARSIALVAEPDTDETLQADRGRILQVFTNLISNAVEHTPEGGRIVVGVRPNRDGQVVFSVADTGHGIAEEDLPHIFGRYWQGKRAGRSGAGLGLAIAKGIVEAHGGRLWAESEIGSGSIFHFTLPAARPANDQLRLEHDQAGLAVGVGEPRQ